MNQFPVVVNHILCKLKTDNSVDNSFINGKKKLIIRKNIVPKFGKNVSGNAIQSLK